MPSYAEGFTVSCRCRPRVRIRSTWRVIARRCNHSAFNGYRRTPSEWSGVQCTGCGAIWRTKAAYVRELPDAPPEWWRKPVEQ